MLSFSLLVGGAPITGFAAGGAIRFVNTQAKFTMRIGVGGLGSFTRIIDNSGTLSVDLLPTSDGNDIFNILLKFSESRLNGANYPVSFIDDTGRYSLVSESAAIMKHPDTTIGDGSGINTWDFISVDWAVNTGGRGATPVFNTTDVPELADIEGIREAK